MAAPLQLSHEKIFAIYTRKRRSGESMERVINQLQIVAQELPREERHQLNRDVVAWEAQFEAENKTAPSVPQQAPATNLNTSVLTPAQVRSTSQIPSAAQAVQTARTGQLQSEAPKLFPTRLLDPNKLAALGLAPTAPTPQSSPLPQSAPLVRPIMPRPQTQPMPSADSFVTCPQCGGKNRSLQTSCLQCGNVLSAKLLGTQPLDKDHIRSHGKTAQFINNSRIFFRVRGYGQALEIHVNEKIVLGCTLPDSSTKPHIDLSPYSAVRLGVSRHHAALQREHGTITITDLDSSNFTYLNGNRLYSHEVRVLRHDDELRLGNLIMRVLFHL